MKRNPLIYCLLAFTFLSIKSKVFGQEASVEGRVILETGEPAFWSNIQILKTQKGTIADSLGHYKLQLSEGKHLIQYSLMGYSTQTDTIQVSAKDSIQKLPLVVLKEANNVLGTVTIKAKTKMKVHRENGHLAVNVANTHFEDTRNVWEGLKKTPLLDTKDKGIEVFGQQALIKINGIETQLSGDNLENYLKSLPPKTVQKIEVQPNPGPEYGPEVSAVVNIILKKGVNNYQIGLRTDNGAHSDYFNRSGANYALNRDKFRLYTNYDFSYEPLKREGKVAQALSDTPRSTYETHSKNTPKNHHVTVNLDFDLTPKDNIVLSNLLNFSDSRDRGVTVGDNLTRSTTSREKNHQLQFTQVWKHQFNDTVSLKAGAYEVFQNSNTEASADNTGAIPQRQEVKTNIPIYIGFVDYKNKNNWGTTSAGLKYRDISVKNRNHNFGEEDFSAPYNYSEKVFAAYVGHSIPFKNGANLQFGLRSETSVIDYKFNSPSNGESFTGKPRYTDLLFNAEYNWSNDKGRIYDLSFRKTIKRPNYSYLNPFQQISSDVIYSSGDTKLDRTQSYILAFYTYKGPWVFSVAGIYMHNFITQFFDEKDGAINLTYRNFRDVYAVQAQAQYNQSFFHDFWQTKTSFTLTRVGLKDPHYKVGTITPNMWFSSNNTLNLSDHLNLDIDFWMQPPFKQGIIENIGTTSSLDLTLTQKIGNNFSMSLYARDLFKSSGGNMRTTVPGYFYQENTYEDSRAFGLALRYTFTGSSYKVHKIQKAEDDALNRLD